MPSTRTHSVSTNIAFASWRGNRGRLTKHAFPSHTGGSRKGHRFLDRQRAVGSPPGSYGFKALCGAYSEDHPMFGRHDAEMCKRCTEIIESAHGRLMAQTRSHGE